MHSFPDLSQSESGPSTGFAPMATAFPVPAPIQPSNLPRPSFGGNRFQTNTMSNPNLRQSFHELVSPTATSTTGTLDSSSTGNSVQQSGYNVQQQLGGDNALSDLSGMTFPSADPFAYPNQPMVEFDSARLENFNIVLDGSQLSPMFLSNSSSGPGIYADLKGQLFGPLPLYLMQDQQNFEIQGHMESGNAMIGALNPQEMNYHTGVTPSGAMNFDGMFFGDGDE